jgi:Holliday junction resolvase RusA-like endonuclease
MFSTNFIVYGLPIAKGRQRFRRVGSFVRTYTPAKTVGYETLVSQVAKVAMGTEAPLETPVSVCVYVKMPIPASYSKKRVEACLSGQERHLKKPDLDNICKSVLDGMNGIVYKDDCQITSLHMTKVYSTTPSVEILISEDLI